MFNLLSPKKTIQDKPKKKQSALKPGRIKKIGYPGNVYNVSPSYGNLAIGKRGVFQKSEYDLGEVARVMDIEAYVRQAFNKHVELCLKEGYQIKSRNPEATMYVKKRIREIGESTGRTFDSLLRGIVSNMVSFSNCFVVKVRDKLASSGEYRLDYRGERLAPVAGYFILDPTTMEIKRNLHGKVYGYLQRMPGAGVYPKFKPYDMVHMFYNRKEGFAFGTPYIVPVLDDIRSLRRMEENIEMLTIAHLYPLYQYIVGTEDHPAEVYEDGTTEVDLIKDEIESMPTEGSIVTPERHEIKVLGADGKALDANPYLKHFEMRVLAGLGISEIALGRGGTANRSCYSEDTETLTDSGWKYYWQVTVDDKIATFNPTKNSLEFHKPNGDILLYDYTGKMIHFKNRNVDVMVTPDHDMWVGYENDSGRGVAWGKEHAEDIRTKRVKFLSGGLVWNGIEAEDFRLPHVPYKSNISFANSIDFNKIKIEDWLEFLGYFVSEGTLAKSKNKWAMSISQSSIKNPEKTQIIRNCLNRLPFKFNEYTDKIDGTTRFWINCKSLYLYLQENCGDYSYTKHFPVEILSYNSRLLRIMFEAAMLGDGTTDLRDGRTSRAYYSSSDMLIDQMQEISIKLQYRAHIVPGESCHRLLLSKHNFSSVLMEQVETVDYTGKVYCFSVPNHLFITRRKGRVGIHGNTADTIDKGMQDRCKDFQDVTETFVNEFMIKELLLEGGFKVDEKEENIVKLEFNEIDIDSQIKLENHSVFKYEHDAVSEPEMRGLLGKDPIGDEDREDMFLERVTIPKITAEADASIKIAKESPQPTGGSTVTSGSSVKKESSVKKKKDGANREQPTNQHGTKTAKTRAKQDGLETTSKEKLLEESLEDIKKLSSKKEDLDETILIDSQDTEVLRQYDPGFVNKLITDLTYYWNITKEDVFDYIKQTYIEENKSFREFTPEKLKMILFLTKDSIVRRSGSYVFQAFKDGIDKAAIDSGRNNISLSINPAVKHKYLEERIELYTMGLLSDLGTQLVRELNPEFSDKKEYKEKRNSVIPTIAGVFDTLKYRLKFTAHTEVMKAYNFGYALAMRELGYKELYMKLADNYCKKCEEVSSKPLSLEYFSFEDVAPIHPMCNCTYMIRKP